MYSGTHVSFGGCLYKVSKGALPQGAIFLGYGRLVHPKGSYIGAPYVALYRSSSGYFAVI